jgi:DnaJ-class molecular chaperone
MAENKGPHELPVHRTIDEMEKLRDLIPPEDRCTACDGFGLVTAGNLATLKICQQCQGTGSDRRN